MRCPCEFTESPPPESQVSISFSKTRFLEWLHYKKAVVSEAWGNLYLHKGVDLINRMSNADMQLHDKLSLTSHLGGKDG